MAREQDSYLKWTTEPTPENMSRVVSELDPVISSELYRYDGPRDLLRGRARVIAAESVRSYDPGSGAALKTWVTGNLRGLTRYSRQLKPVHASEDAHRGSAEIARVRSELSDTLNREPDYTELADATGMSVPKIKRLERARRSVVSESAFEGESDDSQLSLPGTVQSHRLPEYAEGVYESLSERDRKIFDMKTGRAGGAPVPNHIIAKRLGLSPAYVSQRGKELALRIRDMGARSQ